MKFRKKTVTIIITAAAVAAVLAIAFFAGGNSGKSDTELKNTSPTSETSIPDTANADKKTDTPDKQDEAADTDAVPEEGDEQTKNSSESTVSPTPSATDSPSASENAAGSNSQKTDIDESTETDQYGTQPVPEGKPAPVEPSEAVKTDEEYTCTVSINCSTILDNMDLISEDKRDIVPSDGWILSPVTVTFKDGDSVFDVLQQVCKDDKIQMEFTSVPMYNSDYIEGINNLYEFDCGELSGWVYSVDGWFPNYGCSRYAVKSGDEINLYYTCELGNDIDGYAAD